ncbi:translation initiation factor IF-2 [Streptomyces sp. NPDC018610]|uniref:translation initiation factor IF-2 n=1 Tax=Streptomyces sp. NPDC018610 TaxID=3365049 RepID=UPI0037B769F6
MSHEQMLAWLDQANSGEVQAAASRLATAATEIQKIGEQLKLRPQMVEWKGEGADAFRSWANDLANSTLRLADFSKAAGEQLGHASNAIATAQASIPRDTKSAQANLDAATAAHNDPDAAAIRAKSAGELAALKANQEKVRQEAADQMRKLAQSYQASTSQMNSLERPKFPPPPKTMMPGHGETSEDLARPGSGMQGAQKGVYAGGGSGAKAVGGSGTASPEHHSAVVTPGPHAESLRRGSTPESDTPEHLGPPTPAPSPHVGVDSVGTLPDTRQQPPAGPTNVPSTTNRPDPGPVLPTNAPIPPMAGGAARLPSASGQVGKQFSGGRVSGQTGLGPGGSTPFRGVTGATPAPGRSLPSTGGATGRPVTGVQQPASGRGSSSGSGITGGRPSANTGTGRSTGRLRGGALSEGPAGGRGSTGRTPLAGQSGQAAARATGPTTGRAMPSARDGIVGGTQQRPGRTPTRPGAPVPSAPTRGGISGGVPSERDSRGRLRDAAGGSTAGARKRRDKRDDERRGERPTTE